MVQHIRCARCRFVRPDRKADESDWTAYACGNPDSEYYRALLNVSLDGDKLGRITWKGCAHGKPGKMGAAR